jgi:hypothetical protein
MALPVMGRYVKFRRIFTCPTRGEGAANVGPHCVADDAAGAAEGPLAERLAGSCQSHDDKDRVHL